MPAIIFALISYFTWGTGVLVEAIVARRLASYSVIFWSSLLSASVMSLYAPFATSDLAGLTFNLLLFIIAIGLIGLFFGGIMYYEALKISNRALVGTIASSFPAVTVIISILFLGEKVSSQQNLAIVIIFIGLILSTLNFKELRNKRIFHDKGILLAFAPMFSWGLWLALIKIPVNQVGWFWPNYFTFLLFPIIFLYMRFRKIKLERPTMNKVLCH